MSLKTFIQNFPTQCDYYGYWVWRFIAQVFLFAWSCFTGTFCACFLLSYFFFVPLFPSFAFGVYLIERIGELVWVLCNFHEKKEKWKNRYIEKQLRGRKWMKKGLKRIFDNAFIFKKIILSQKIMKIHKNEHFVSSYIKNSEKFWKISKIIRNFLVN